MISPSPSPQASRRHSPDDTDRCPYSCAFAAIRTRSAIALLRFSISSCRNCTALPERITHDPQFQHLGSDPAFRWVGPGQAAACLRVLEVTQPVPDEHSTIEFIVDNPGATAAPRDITSFTDSRGGRADSLLMGCRGEKTAVPEVVMFRLRSALIWSWLGTCLYLERAHFTEIWCVLQLTPPVIRRCWL